MVTAAVTEAGVFELDVRVQTQPTRPELTACSTDDGCGHTCQISACHSQR